MVHILVVKRCVSKSCQVLGGSLLLARASLALCYGILLNCCISFPVFRWQLFTASWKHAFFCFHSDPADPNWMLIASCTLNQPLNKRKSHNPAETDASPSSVSV